jgi:hypothetical protein
MAAILKGFIHLGYHRNPIGLTGIRRKKIEKS